VLQQTNNAAQSVVILHSNRRMGVRMTVGNFFVPAVRLNMQNVPIVRKRENKKSKLPSQNYVSRSMRTLEVSKGLIWEEATPLKWGLQENRRLRWRLVRAGARCVLRQVVFVFLETDLVLPVLCVTINYSL
jgi:hypothetical protein